MGEESDHSTTETTTLRKAIVFISSLISLSHSIKVFSAKWQSIRYKLEELFSNLTAIDKWESADNFSVLDSILATLKKCDELATQCLELSYTGKLLMQSNLDIVSAKIDAHIKNIFDIYAVGLLTRSDAIVVSRPSTSASRDDARFYVVDLLSRFKIGSTDMKKQALIAFNQVIQQDERYLTISLQLDNFLGFLVNFLDFKDSEIQHEAAKSACLIAGLEPYKSALIGAGVIAPLIRVIESGSEASKELAATCLLLVTENADNAWSVSAHGGATALLKICSSGGGSAELVALACGVLKNLVGVDEIKRFVVEEGGIPAFVDLAKSKDEVIKIRSVDLLQTMAYGDESVSEMMIEEGGVRALVRVFCPKSSLATKTREMALRGIVNICCSSSSENSLHLLVNYGFMDHILYFLRHGELSVQELSLKTAFWLSGTSEEGKKVMGEAGFMPVLVRFLDSKSIEIREMAAETISSMILLPKNRKRFVQNDQNLGLVLQMLEVSSGNKNLLLSILMSLTSSNTARRKIANSGYLKHIEKLAEAQVSDAKKIVRKISSNRLGSILNGIWH